MARYPYGPPPPPPTAAPSPGYPQYGQTHPYTPTPPRNDGGGHGGRGRGGHHASGRSDYGSYYQNQEYTAQQTQPYGNPPANGYWQGNPQVTSHSNGAALPPSNYHPNYAPQAYAQPPTPGYHQPPYSGQPPRPTYASSYGQPPPEYPQPPQWSAPPQTHTSYGGRGGRGAYQGAQGGHKSDQSMGPPIRMGFDQSNNYAPPPPQPSSSGYAQPFPPSAHQQTPAPYQHPPFAPYSSTPTYQGPAPTHSHHGHHNRGGRGGFGQGNRGRSHGRGDHKNHKGQRSNNTDTSHSQKSDAAPGKKKKRKTNTLGLTPDEGDESNDDEEARLVSLIGNEMPVIPDDSLPQWIAERKANYPTKARIQAKQEAQKKAAEETKSTTETAKPEDPEARKIEEEEQLLLARLKELQKSKRKRELNYEGDEMRNSGAPELKTEADDEDDAPEVQSSRKPPPISSLPTGSKRADPQSHCKYYATGGNCGKKDKCRFRHDTAMRTAALEERTRNGGKMTLKQRLILNDKEADDLEVVKAIVDLRFTERLTGNRDSPDGHESSPAPSGVSSLPGSSGAANLPPNPTTVAQRSSS